MACGAAAETFLILPFSNLSKTSNLDWVGESIAESMREALAGEGLLALGREDREEAYRRLSIRPYRPMTTASALRLAETLDADQVVFGSFDVLPPEGSTAQGRGTVRITARVVDMRKGKRGPQYTELDGLDDLARLQNHLAWETLQVLVPKNAPTEEQFRQRTPLIRVDAMEHYTRGLLAAAPEQKVRLFSQAVRLAPQYSHVWFELGKLQWTRKDYRSAIASLTHVAQADAHFREAQFYLGLSKYMAADYVGAQQAFEFVAGVVPLNEVLNNLGVSQLKRNAPDALANLRKALEGDPSDPDYHFNVGLALYKSGKYDEAVASFRSVLDRNAEDHEAAQMLERAQTPKPRHRRGAAAPEIAGRLKSSYEESAWRQLKAMVEAKP
jgi:tetratricopeptide (TPR) repeat protein